MTKLVLAMIAVVIVACGGDDPYSPFDNDEWRNESTCSYLGESVTAELWSEIADLNRSEREEFLNERWAETREIMFGGELPSWVPCDIECVMDKWTCLWWLNENAEWSDEVLER